MKPNFNEFIENYGTFWFILVENTSLRDEKWINKIQQTLTNIYEDFKEVVLNLAVIFIWNQILVFWLVIYFEIEIISTVRSGGFDLIKYFVVNKSQNWPSRSEMHKQTD